MRRTKCLSGAEKKKKRKRLDAVTQSQKGALDKFIVKKSQASSEVEAHTAEFDEGDSGDERADAYTDDDSDDANTDDEGNDANTGVEDNDATPIALFNPDIFDPRYWEGLDPKMVDILLQ
nr:uncharacterized protein LOC127330677 [Lolium perenne]